MCISQCNGIVNHPINPQPSQICMLSHDKCRARDTISSLNQNFQLDRRSTAQTQSWAIHRQQDNCWGLKTTPSPSSAPLKLDPGDVLWDLLCFCRKAPTLLNTHSESLGKLCNHASASWQRTAVWRQFCSAP